MNKVGTAILTLNADFSTAHQQGANNSPRLVSERRARRNLRLFHYLARARIRDHVFDYPKFTPTDSREEPAKRMGFAVTRQIPTKTSAADT